MAAPSGCASPALHLPGHWAHLRMGVLHPSPQHRVCSEVTVHHLTPANLTPCTETPIPRKRWGNSHSMTSGVEKWGNVPGKPVYSEIFFTWFSWFGLLCGCFAFFHHEQVLCSVTCCCLIPAGSVEGLGGLRTRVHIGGCPAPLGHPNGETMGCISCSSSLSGPMDEYL